MKEKIKAQAEVDRILQTDHDMFELYLKKPAVSSVGFLVLAQQRENRRDKSGSPIFSDGCDTIETDIRKRSVSKLPTSAAVGRGVLRTNQYSNLSPHSNLYQDGNYSFSIENSKHKSRHSSQQDFSQNKG